MNTYSKLFENKELPEIKNIIDNTESLTYEAKLALQKIITEKYSDNNYISSEKIQNLNSSLESDDNNIKSLRYLNYIGIDLFKENDKITVRKSNSAKIRDFWGIFLSSFMIIFLLLSIYYRAKFFLSEFQLSGFISAIIITSIGILGLILFLKTLDRITFYKDFFITKTNDNIIINQKHNKDLNRKRFPTSSKLYIQHSDNEDIITLVLRNDTENINIIGFKDINSISLKSLENMVNQFNNLAI